MKSKRRGEITCALVLAGMLAGCGGSGSSATSSTGGNGSSGNPPGGNNPPPAVVSGVATPSNVAVVTATNAN